MTTHYHTGTLTIDAAEGYCECEAVFKIDATWSTQRVNGMRQLYSAQIVWVSNWTFNKLPQTEATALAILGTHEFDRQCQLALEEWRETAVQDEAAEYGDYQLQQRRDADMGD